MDKRPLHVGFISSYGGTNLGDQAIQTACIENLRSRRPDIEFTGIYLNVWRPAKIHGIQTFPITGLVVPLYSNAQELFGSETPPAAEQNTVSQPAGSSFLSGVRNVLKRSSALRGLVDFCRKSGKIVVNPFREMHWLGKSWRLVRRMDAVIVTGGGQFSDEWGGCWGHPYCLLRWAVLCRLQRRKFIILSVGVGSIKTSLSRRFFAKAVQLADYASYRDPKSASRAVQELSNRTPPELVYDLACTLPYLDHARSASTTSAMVAIGPIAYSRPGTWHQADINLYRNYLQSLSRVVCELLNRGLQVTLFTTSGNDRLATNELMEFISATSAAAASAVQVVHPGTTEHLLDLLAQARLVIVSRLHGAILSQLIGKPVIAISPDQKVNAQMQQFMQEDLLLPIATASAADVLALVDKALTHEVAIKGQLAESRNKYYGDVIAQYDTVLRHIEAPAIRD